MKAMAHIKFVSGRTSPALRRPASAVGSALLNCRHSSGASTAAFDVCVIGGGPGGYVAAIRAAQLGLRTVCVERRGSLGGTCLNVGCIPSKSLLHNSHLYHQVKYDMEHRGISVKDVGFDLNTMMKQKDRAVQTLTKGIEVLFDKNGVSYAKGHGTLLSPTRVRVALLEGGERFIDAKYIVLATGSDVQGLLGIAFDEERIVSSTGALSLKRVPERMVVIGGGVIGLELGSVWSRLGSDVTIVEYLPSIGGAGIDVEVSRQLLTILKKQGIKFRLKTKVTGVESTSNAMSVTMEDSEGGNEACVDADVVLVCVGRREFMDDLGIEALGIALEGRKIKIDSNYQTTVPNIYAIGDVVRGPMLAHKAEDEGFLVAEYLATNKAPHLDSNSVPSVIYTFPEVAWVGRTEDELKEQGIEYKKGKFSFAANSRGKACSQEAGFVKVLACKRTDKLLGVHIVNAAAGELIAEATVALEYGGTAEDVARVCNAHPTLSEALKGAAQMAAFGKAINST